MDLEHFERSLENFKNATAELAEVWEEEGLPGDILGDTYRDLPEFGDLAAAVAGLRIRWCPTCGLPWSGGHGPPVEPIDPSEQATKTQDVVRDYESDRTA